MGKLLLENFFFKIFPSDLVKKEKIPFLFCSSHHRVNNNENQICSKWSVIKWETIIRKCFFFKLFTFGEKDKIPLKTGPKGESRLWGGLYLQ